jgi:hypothetical protein
LKILLRADEDVDVDADGLVGVVAAEEQVVVVVRSGRREEQACVAVVAEDVVVVAVPPPLLFGAAVSESKTKSGTAKAGAGPLLQCPPLSRLRIELKSWRRCSRRWARPSSWL